MYVSNLDKIKYKCIQVHIPGRWETLAVKRFLKKKLKKTLKRMKYYSRDCLGPLTA